MIETVRQRQQSARDFKGCYKNLCALQGSCPLGTVLANLGEYTVDINADRVMLQDWNPILNATRINKNLKVIALRSYWQEKLSSGQSDFPATLNISRKKVPPIRSKDLSYKICRALKECLSVTENLDVLILQDIPLRNRDLVCLSKGLSRNKTLCHLSFENCQISDNGFEVISSSIRNCMKLVSLNLSGCCLTWRGAEMLAKLIKYQATKKHSVAWQDSLRYRVPDLDRMSGMRRLTACKNSLLGDRGAEVLAEALKDDLWLKALDLQQCGISNRGGLAFQSLLRCNKSLIVLDLRINPLIDRDLISSITQHVLVNAGGGAGEGEYAWLSTDQTNTEKVRPSTRIDFPKKRRARSAVLKSSSVSKSKRSPSVATRRLSGGSRTSRRNGVPWRTAARVGSNRHRKTKTAWPYTVTQGSAPMAKQLDVKDNKSEKEENEDDIDEQEDEYDEIQEAEEEIHSSSEEESEESLKSRIKELEIEVNYLKHRVEDESRSRMAESEKVLELQLENKRLQREINFLNAVGLTSRDIEFRREEHRKSHVPKPDFLDDNVLESIENSFKQFHAFLDMLNGAERQDLQRLLDQMRVEKAAGPQLSQLRQEAWE